jgi:hypothetical protein
MAALKFTAFPPPTSEAAVLETCFYLVDARASEEDAEAILDHACKDGNVDVVKPLLRRGTRLEKVYLFRAVRCTRSSQRQATGSRPNMNPSLSYSA